jgi:hypothetical protein
MTSVSSPSTSLSRVALWSILTPFVGLWPFLSAMPAFTLFGGDVGVASATANVLLLMTGFWVVVPLAVVAWYAMPPKARLDIRARPTRGWAPFALYIPVWTALYTTLAMLGF